MSMEPMGNAASIPQVRIIRPGADDSPSGGRFGGGTLLSLNLEDVQALAERFIRDARERVSRLDEEARSLEVRVAQRRAVLQVEELTARRSAEAQIAGAREAFEAEASSLRLEAIGKGRAEGLEEGRKAGREEGYRKGFEEGYREGREAGYREAHQAESDRLKGEAGPLCQSLGSLIQEIGSRRETILRAAREELLPLAMEIAKKIIKREIRECPDAALHNVRKAIDLSFRRNGLTVHVHPEDLALVQRYAPDLAGSFTGIGNLSILSCEDVGRGGCRVVSGSGMVDLRVETQLELIEQTLFRQIGESDPFEAPARAPSGVPPAAPASPAVPAVPKAAQALKRILEGTS